MRFRTGNRKLKGIQEIQLQDKVQYLLEDEDEAGRGRKAVSQHYVSGQEAESDALVQQQQRHGDERVRGSMV